MHLDNTAKLTNFVVSENRFCEGSPRGVGAEVAPSPSPASVLAAGVFCLKKLITIYIISILTRNPLIVCQVLWAGGAAAAALPSPDAVGSPF